MSAPDPRLAFFERHAPKWDTYGPPPTAILARLDGLRDDLQLATGQTVLEVGGGTGQVTAWLVTAVTPGRVVSVDFSAAMITQARARVPQAEFRCADVCADDLGTACYDIVWCMHAFPHFRDQAAALRSFARCLRPGGRLLVLHLISWQAVNAMHARVGHEVAGDCLPEPARWQQLLAAAKFAPPQIIARDDLFLLTARRD